METGVSFLGLREGTGLEYDMFMLANSEGRNFVNSYLKNVQFVLIYTFHVYKITSG